MIRKVFLEVNLPVCRDDKLTPILFVLLVVLISSIVLRDPIDADVLVLAFPGESQQSISR